MKEEKWNSYVINGRYFVFHLICMLFSLLCNDIDKQKNKRKKESKSNS